MFNVKKAKEVKITQKPLAAWRQSFAGSSEANKTVCNAVHLANVGGKLAESPKLGQYLRIYTDGALNFYQLSSEKLFIASKNKY